jgi:hypothetical protein
LRFGSGNAPHAAEVTIDEAMVVEVTGCVNSADVLADSVVEVRRIVAVEGTIDGVSLAWVWRDDAAWVSDGSDCGEGGNWDEVGGTVEV